MRKYIHEQNQKFSWLTTTNYSNKTFFWAYGSRFLCSQQIFYAQTLIVYKKCICMFYSVRKFCAKESIIIQYNYIEHLTLLIKFANKFIYKYYLHKKFCSEKNMYAKIMRTYNYQLLLSIKKISSLRLIFSRLFRLKFHHHLYSTSKLFMFLIPIPSIYFKK